MTELPGSASPSRVKPWWRRRLPCVLGAAALLLIAIYACRDTAALAQTPPPPPVQPGPHASGGNGPQVSLAPPEPSLTALEPQLEKVMAALRQANQQKNLPQFLMIYSPTFPNLAQRVQKVSEAWEKYDYLVMDFKLAEIKALGENGAEARVTWAIQTLDRRTQARKNFTQTYRVWFVRESGDWCIKALEKAK